MSTKKVIITAKCEADGTSISDRRDPMSVTEIATELIITRLVAISMLREGIISDKSVIVTVPDRVCLYSQIYDEVIDWQYFKENLEKYAGLDIDDLLEPSRFHSFCTGSFEKRLIPYKPFYQNWERDKDLILNIEEPATFNYDTSKSFVCLVIRTRQAWPEKNLSKEYWDELILEFQNHGVHV